MGALGDTANEDGSPSPDEGSPPGGWPQGPKGPWAPLGGDTLARGLVGVRMFTLGVSPRVILPDARGPLEVLVGTSQESWENSILDIRVLFTWLLLHTSTCFFPRDRPPEELDNKRSSTRRGEFDSSTPEVIGVLFGYIFLA